MFRGSRVNRANPAMRLFEYYRLRDWEIGLQKMHLRGNRSFYKNIPWTFIGVVMFSMIAFGIDLGIGLTHGATQNTQALKEAKEADAKKRKQIKEMEMNEKRDMSISAMQAHKEGRGPLAQFQASEGH